MIEITEVKIFKKFSDSSKLKAIASITFNDVFVVHQLKVIEGNQGLFVAMPSRKLSGGEFKDVAHPIRKEFREKIEKAVLDSYNTAE